MSKVIKKINEWQKLRAEIPYGKSIGLVATMGALHQGHISLLERARLENDITVLTIFVNPTQFNDEKDYLKYPRNFEQDIAAAEKAQVDYIFIPEHGELYPDNYAYQINETLLSKKMEGIHRPGHFQGMLTIVMKLLLIIRPQKAYFGEKDYQQLLLVEGLTKAFFLDTEIVACKTLREATGLPLSSRNKLLTAEEKILADNFAHIFQKTHLPATEIMQLLNTAGIKTEYVEDENARRFCAVKIGNIRLIDNRPLE